MGPKRRYNSIMPTGILTHRRSLLGRVTEVPPPSSGLFGDWRFDIGAYQDSDRTSPATANDDPVGGVTDQSGNGNHLAQTTSGRRPLLKTGGPNGYKYIKFDASDDIIKWAGTLDVPIAVWLVVKPVSWISGAHIFAGGSDDNLSLYQYSSSPTVRTWNGTSSGSNNGDLSIGSWAVVQASFPNGSAGNLQVNENSGVSTGTASSMARGGISLGGHPNLSNYSDIELVRALLYNSAQSAGDITATRNALNATYGIF